ncbi:DUF2341 domain-containing protein [Bacteroidales bacterium]|nr:DUF2341 domain-containing protein [Bacteroidales bacterium]
MPDYEHRLAVQIKHSQISGTDHLTDFPVLLQIIDSNMRHVNKGGYVENIHGYDINITASDGVTPLEFEIEKYVSDSGIFIGWVKVPVLSTTVHTKLYVYYGNGAVAVNPSDTATWTTDYRAVWHLADTSNAASDYTFHGKVGGDAFPTTGFIGDGYFFDGVGDTIKINASAPYTIDGNSPFTVSCWVNVDSVSGINQHHTIWGIRNSPLGSGTLSFNIGKWTTQDNYINFPTHDTAQFYNHYSNSEIPPGEWSHIACIYDGSDISIYINGDLDVKQPYTPPGDYTIEPEEDISRYGSFGGGIDELRIINSQKTAGWIKTEYANQLNPNSFCVTNYVPNNLLLSSNRVDENQAIATTVGVFFTVDPNINDVHTYTFVAGVGDDDNNSFIIEDNELRTNLVFNAEMDSTYSVRIRATDDGADNYYYDTVFAITINDINEGPNDIELTGNNVNEGLAIGTMVGVLSTSDVDKNDTHTYAFVNQPAAKDNAGFVISNDTLFTADTFNYELKDTCTIGIRTTDLGGAIYDEVFSISINDVNEPPTQITLSSSNLEEGQPVGALVGLLSTADEDADDSFIYALVAGSESNDNSKFNMLGDSLKAIEIFDFDDKNSYIIRVRVTDLGNLWIEKVFEISILNVNSEPTIINISSSEIVENSAVGTQIGVLSTIDRDDPDSHSYTLVSGDGDTDNASFSAVDSMLWSANVFDFESKSTYSIRLRTTDNGVGSLFFEDVLIITVTDINEAITFTSQWEGEAIEDSVYSYNISTIDDDGDSIVITAPVLPSWLSITDNKNGTAILTGTPQNSDVGTHDVTLRAHDSTVGTDQIFVISVSNVNDAPVFTSIPEAVAFEDQKYQYDINTSDDDGDSLVISLLSAPAWVLFTVKGDGTASLQGTPAYQDITTTVVELKVSDGVENKIQTFSLEVRPGYVAPVAVRDVFETDEDLEIELNVLSNDLNQQEELLITTMQMYPQNGTATLSKTGDLEYLPNADFYGIDSISYITCIKRAPFYCSTATVVIKVLPVNDSPVAQNISYEVQQTGMVEICVPLTDVDSDDISVSELVNSINYYSNGFYDGTQLCFEYEIPQDYLTDNDSLIVLVCDDEGLCDRAIVNFNFNVSHDVEIASALSPNGDGKNDFWIVNLAYDDPRNNVKIFNRWGGLVYEIDHYDNISRVWDGEMNRGAQLGQKVPDGTYFYIIEFKGLGNVKTGYIVVN